MLPKKIYLREADFDDLFTSERMVACDEPYSDINVEFTDLSQVWHNTSEEPKFNEDIIIADHFDAVWFTAISIVNERFKNWENYVEKFGVKNWAYVFDILPKGDKK